MNIPKAKQKRPMDEGWTGAEIRACVQNAWEQNVSLCEAAEYITPIAISSPDQVQSLRKQASNKYISASYPGLYRYATMSQPASGRKID